ncbi:hypothetical protein EYF80_055930 [Liparis tanakae]|uniref:Uncharacterized protein n=1 Tax=Liparis tanakae TaxID=230148 RepID=A0A4Z2EY57_9TELE|nr:hypothetical protein EYF80_055930 [Liparis tanakae]
MHLGYTLAAAAVEWARAKSTPLTHTPSQNAAAGRPSAARPDRAPLAGIQALDRIVREKKS